MAVEKFIKGKKDNCNHVGLYSNRRRDQASQYELDHWEEIQEEQKLLKDKKDSDRLKNRR